MRSARRCVADSIKRGVDPYTVTRYTASAVADQHFRASCLHCGQAVVIASRIDEAALDRLRAHLLTCCPSEVVSPYPSVDATLHHFHVVPTVAAPPD